jgi:hypothetical protein
MILVSRVLNNFLNNVFDLLVQKARGGLALAFCW